MKILLSILLLVAVAQSQVSEEEAVNLIHKIDATTLGKTLLDSVMVEIKTEGPLESLQQTLHDLEDRYIADQKEDDARNYAYQQQCDDDIASYDKELAVSTNKKIGLEAKLEGDLNPRKSVIQGVVNSKTKEVADYQKKLDKLDQHRYEESEEFNQTMREHDQATAIITQVRRMFEENIQEPSFLQTNESVSLIQKHLHEGVLQVKKFKHKKGYGAIFKMLSEIAGSKSLANQDNLNRLGEVVNMRLESSTSATNCCSRSTSQGTWSGSRRTRGFSPTRRPGGCWS